MLDAYRRRLGELGVQDRIFAVLLPDGDSGATAAEGTSGKAASALAAAAAELQERGCKGLALAGASAQKLAFRLAGESPLPQVTMAEALRDEVLAQGYASVFFLGSYPAMKEGFLKRPLIFSHIPVITPSEQEKLWLDQMLGEVRTGAPCAPAAERILKMLSHGKEEGAAAAILADATLAELLAGTAAPLPLIDAQEAHIKAIADRLG